MGGWADCGRRSSGTSINLSLGEVGNFLTHSGCWRMDLWETVFHPPARGTGQTSAKRAGVQQEAGAGARQAAGQNVAGQRALPLS